tara:strand:+ start:389 stop:5623 length:5235 start_codon:yes stop_codon:yes gene_type:complete
MEEEEILQFIANAQKQGKSEQSIRRSLRVRGVVDSDQYLKKKDDTSTSASASGEAGTESQQVTAPQGGQELGSSVSPLAPQPESNIATQLTGLSDPQVDPISGEVAPWTDTPANRARLEIDPVHYDAFQKSGFVRAMEGVGSQYVTPEVTGIFNDFVTANDWWWNAVDSNVEKVSKELAKNDLYLQEKGIEYKKTSVVDPTAGSSALIIGDSYTVDLPQEQIYDNKVKAVNNYLNDQIQESVRSSMLEAMPKDIKQSDEALKYTEQYMLENYGSMVDLTGEGQVGSTPFLKFDGFGLGPSKSTVYPKFSGYLVDKFDAAGIDLVNAMYNLFGGEEKDITAMREKADEVRANTLQFTESMSGSFTDGQFGNGLMQLSGFLSESVPTMSVLIPAATVTTVASGGVAAPWWVTAGLIGVEGATLSTAVEAARTRNHPMFKRYTKDGKTIGHEEMMLETGGDPELMGQYKVTEDTSARWGHLSTVFGTDFVTAGASTLFFLRALKGAGSSANVGNNMNAWWNAHLSNLGYSVPINSVTASTAAMAQYVSLLEQSGQEYDVNEVFELGLDVALGVTPITVGVTGAGSAISYVQTKSQIVNALARDAVGRNGGNIKINQQRTKFLEILRNSTDRNEKIYAERQLVALEEQKLSSISQDEQFYLRMNPEDYEAVLDLHREYNRGLRELNSLDDPDGAAGKAIREDLDAIKDRRLKIEGLYDAESAADVAAAAPPPPPLTTPEGAALPTDFTPGLSSWWYVEFFDKYGNVNSLQRSIMEKLDQQGRGVRVDLSQDFEVLQKLSTSKAGYLVDQMIDLRSQDGGLINQLRDLQRTTDASLYNDLPEVYSKNIIGLYDRWSVAKFAPERNKKILADNQSELDGLLKKVDGDVTELSAKDRSRVRFLEEKIASRKGSGMADEQAEAFLASIPEDLMQAFESVREEHRAIQQNTRDAALEYGFIDQAMYDKMQATSENYVTLTGDGMKAQNSDITLIDNTVVEQIFPSRPRQGGVPDPLRKASGRSDETGSILAKTIDQNTQIHVAGQKNVALQALYELLTANPSPEHYTISDEGSSTASNTVMVYLDGQQKYITFANELYAKPFKTAGPSDNEAYVRLIQPLQRFVSLIPKMYTQFSTTFFAGNAPRDYQASLANALSAAEKKFGYALYNSDGNPLDVIKLVKDSHLVGRGEFFKSFKAIAADEFSVGNDIRALDNVLYQEYKKHGGQTGWAFAKPLEDLQQQLSNEIDEGIKGQKVTKFLYDNTFKFIESFNNTFENTFRFQVYKALRNQNVAPDYAAAVAKDVSIDFNRSGNTTPKISAAKFFLNAGLQGADMTVQTTTALRPKVDPTGKERNPIQRLTNAQKVLLGSVGFTYMLTQFNQMVTETDRDGVTFYDKVPDHVKQRNFVVMLPGSAEGARIDIPKFYGFGGIADIGLTIAEVQNRERDLTDAALYLGSSIVHNMSPIYFGEVGQESDPTKSVDIVKQPGVLAEALLEIDPVAPLVNVAQNVDNFGNPITREPKDDESRASMATDSPSLLKDVAEVLNASWVSGGSDQVSGDLDFNPDALNYLLQNYLGSSYVMFGDAADVVLKQAAGQTELETFPIIKKFYGTDNEYMAYANYYQAKSVVNSYLAEFGNVEDLIENKDKELPSRDERLQDYEATEREPGGARKRYGNALAVAEVIQDVESELVELRESKKTLQKQQDALEYDMFNLEVADEYQGLEEKIYDLEQTEMLLFETVLKEYYKYYAKKPE